MVSPKERSVTRDRWLTIFGWTCQADPFGNPQYGTPRLRFSSRPSRLGVTTRQVVSGVMAFVVRRSDRACGHPLDVGANRTVPRRLDMTSQESWPDTHRRPLDIRRTFGGRGVPRALHNHRSHPERSERMGIVMRTLSSSSSRCIERHYGWGRRRPDPTYFAGTRVGAATNRVGEVCDPDPALGDEGVAETVPN